MPPSQPDRKDCLDYVVAFEQRLLGARCRVEVSVALDGGATKVEIAMMRSYSPEPSFVMTRDDLAALAAAIDQARDRSGLLGLEWPQALAQQFRFESGGTSLAVFKAPGKPARFALSIGLFSQEGELSELSSGAVDQALAAVDALARSVAERVNGA